MITRLKNRAFMVGNMVFLYRLIASSERLLEIAAGYAPLPLLEYYLSHLEEERGHQQMLGNDLRDMGVIDIPRSLAACQIAGSQYYLIEHEHPAALLGYMHFLESSAMSVADVDAAEALHGVKLSCCRHHALHDPAHAAELERQIAAQPPELQGLIAWNANCVRASMNQVFDQIWAGVNHGAIH